MRTLTINNVDFEVIIPKRDNIEQFNKLFKMEYVRTLRD